MRSHIESAGTIQMKAHAVWPEGLQGRDLDAYALVYLEAGSGYYWDAAVADKIEVRAGDVLVLFPGLRHRYGRAQTDPLWSERYVVFSGPIFEELERDQLLNRDEPIWHTHNDAAFRQLFAQVVTDTLSGRQHIQPHQLLSQLHQLISDAHRLHHHAINPHSDWRERACAALGDDLGLDISIAALAKDFDCSEQVFRKRFKKELGISPQQFRLQRRLDQAQDLLLDAHNSLADVADACGFCDQYQFSRMFKRHRGRSPGRFRQEQGLSPRVQQ